MYFKTNATDRFVLIYFGFSDVFIYLYFLTKKAMSLFEVTVGYFEANLEGWSKSPYEDNEIKFSKDGQSISFIVRKTSNAPRLKRVDCIAVSGDIELRKKVSFIGGPWADPLRVIFKGYKTVPVYEKKAEAVIVFIKSLI